MTTLGRTIQVYLPHGEPRGIRIAEFTTRIVQALAFPRHMLNEAMERVELAGVGTYFLLGQREESQDPRPSVYIGEAEDCAVRIRTHNSDSTKEFWQSAVAIVSRTERLTKAHVRLLEFMAIQRTAAVGRYRLENANTGIEPTVPEALRAEVYELFETMEVLLSVLGYPIFDPIGLPVAKISAAAASGDAVVPGRSRSPSPLIAELPDSTILFEYKGDRFHAKLVYNEDGFVVLKGSTIRPEVLPSAKEYERKRERFLRDGVLVREGSLIRFERDFAFSSPSAAAVMVSGASVNGWDAWIDNRGRSLSQIYRSGSE